MTKTIFLVVITVAIILIAYVHLEMRSGLTVKVVTPERGAIVSYISATGRVVSAQESEITSSVTARVVNVLALEGELASRGKPLVLLDDREAVTTINSERAAMVEAAAKVEQSERNLKALRQIYQVGGASLSSIQEAELQLALERANQKKVSEQLRHSELQRERFRIVAPFAGILVKKKVQIGDLAVPGNSLFTLANLSSSEIEVSVDESDAGAVQIGQGVEFSCEALPGQIWKEKVLRIEPAVRKEGNANSLKLRVSMSQKHPHLRLGQQVDVKIKLAEKQSVTQLPFEAVMRRDGKSYLATVRQGKVHLLPVLTGLEDARSVEIVSSLGFGEEVILSEGKELHEGDLVIAVTRQHR